MGLDFPMQHWVVTPYKSLPSGHMARQALELEPWELVNLVLFGKKQSGTNLILACFILQSALSCIRFEHAQRSHPESETKAAAMSCTGVHKANAGCGARDRATRGPPLRLTSKASPSSRS